MKAKSIALLIFIALSVLIILNGCELLIPVSRVKRINNFEDDLNLAAGKRGDTYLNFHPSIRAPIATETAWDTNFRIIDSPFTITIDSQVDDGDGTWTVDCSYTDSRAGGHSYTNPHLRFDMRQSDDDWFIWSLTIDPNGGSTITIP